MLENILLLCMIISYSISIAIVTMESMKHESISAVVCNKKNNSTILLSMSFMFLFTILYESLRKDIISIIIIVLLIIGIAGVLCTIENEIRHTIYAVISFMSILVFMFHHMKMNNILKYIFYIQVMFGTVMLIWLYMKYEILTLEALSLVNFIIYYLYLHYITYYKNV